MLPKNLIRYGLVLLGTAAAVGCSSGDGGTDPGSITLSITPTSATVVQGGSQTVSVTLTRVGGFNGTVNLDVTGEPAGVTATLSNVQDVGAVTTGTVTIVVGATVAPALYPLVLHGTGSGVAEVTQNFALTVTAPATPAYTLTLSAPTLSIVQGAATPTTTVNLVRTNFTGNVTLTVENLPTGVTAAFNPASPISGNSSVLTLTVAANAPVGTFTNLLVRGVATGLTDRTAPLSLTITAAPAPSFTLSLSAPALSIALGASTPTTTVTIARTNFTGDVALSVLNLPTGVTASFAPPNPQTGNSSVLTLTVAANATLGTFTNLSVQGVGTPGTVSTPLSLTIIAAPPPPSFTLSLTAATLSIAQGASTPTTTVNIARTNFTGDIALSVLNLPTGVTAAFAPANPQTGTSSVLTLTVAASAPVGTFTNLSVQGVGTAGTVATPLSLTITAAAPAPSFVLSLTAPTLSIARGASTPTTTVNIARTNFTGDITLSVLNLPTGVTAAFAPANPQSGNSSVLTLTVGAAAPLGTFTNLSVQGVGTAGTVSTPLSLTITAAPGGSGNVTVTFATCPAASKAVWLAFQDGPAGTWTAVTGVGDVYQFNITQSKGSFAYVTLGTGTSTIIVQHFTQAEIIAGIFNFCGTVTPNTRVANGTVSNLPGGFLGQISFGGGFASAFADGPFQITAAMTGTFDLVGFAHPLAGAGADRAFVKRGENPAAGGNFSVPVNFTDATLSAAAATATATLQGLVGGETLLNHGMNFFTQGTSCVPGSLYGIGTTAASFSVFGVPASLRVGTDMHAISIIAGSTTSFRSLNENFLDVVARAATPFVLPAQLPVPVATDAGGPYKRPSIAVTGVPAELNISHALSYTTTAGKFGLVTATQGWVGGSNVTLVLPNFAGVGTFNNTWAPATGTAVDWSFTSSGGTFTTACAAGQRFVSSTRTGTL